MDGLRRLGDENGLPLTVQGLPMAFNVSFGTPAVAHDYRETLLRDRARYQRLAVRLASAGVWLAGRGIWYLSAAHGDREIETALSRVAETLAQAPA